MGAPSASQGRRPQKRNHWLVPGPRPRPSERREVSVPTAGAPWLRRPVAPGGAEGSAQSSVGRGRGGCRVLARGPGRESGPRGGSSSDMGAADPSLWSRSGRSGHRSPCQLPAQTGPLRLFSLSVRPASPPDLRSLVPSPEPPGRPRLLQASQMHPGRCSKLPPRPRVSPETLFPPKWKEGLACRHSSCQGVVGVDRPDAFPRGPASCPPTLPAPRVPAFGARALPRPTCPSLHTGGP